MISIDAAHHAVVHAWHAQAIEVRSIDCYRQAPTLVACRDVVQSPGVKAGAGVDRVTFRHGRLVVELDWSRNRS